MQNKIQGIVFEITSPYSEGHTISAVEADVLNQVRAENIANNMRSVVEEAKTEAGEGDVNATELQTKVTEYDKTYQFGFRRTRTSDPLQREINELAKGVLTRKVKEGGASSLKAWKEEVGDDAYNAKMEELRGNPKLVKQAKANLTLDI